MWRPQFAIYAAGLASCPGSFGCIGVDSGVVAAGEGLEFVVSLDADGQLRRVTGPFSSGAPLAFTHTGVEGGTLRLIRVDDRRLSELYPRYRFEARLETELGRAEPELESCGAEGRWVDEVWLEVSLGSLRLDDGSSLVSSFAMPGEPGAGEQTELPGGLSLRFPVHPCGHGAELVFREFGASANLFGDLEDSPIHTSVSASALDEDTLIVAGESGLAIARRGAVIDVTLDTFDLRARFPAIEGGEWRLRHAEVLPVNWPEAPATIIAALSWDETTFPFEWERRAGWARLRLSPAGDFTLEDWMSIEPPEGETFASLRFVHTETDGRYFAVGRNLVLTATVPNERPRILGRRNFSGNAAYPLGEALAPHLVLLDRGQTFEGDVFALPETIRATVVEAHFDLRLLRAAKPSSEGAGWIATSSDYRLRRRENAETWTGVPLGVPPSLEVCSAATAVCGRRVLSVPTGAIVAEPGGDGVIFGSEACIALAWRRARDSCAVVSAFPSLALQATNTRGVRALLEDRGHVYVVVDDVYLFEVEARSE